MTIDLNYYFDVYHGTVLTNDEAGEKALNRAYRQINIICKNRLDDGTIDSFPEKVQNIVKTVICEQADFNTDNADLINSALSEYKINGVSVKFETNSQIKNYGGIFIKGELISELAIYGLTYRGF